MHRDLKCSNYQLTVGVRIEVEEVGTTCSSVFKVSYPEICKVFLEFRLLILQVIIVTCRQRLATVIIMHGDRRHKPDAGETALVSPLQPTSGKSLCSNSDPRPVQVTMNQSQATGQVIKLTVPEDFKELSFTFGRKEAGPTTIEITVKFNGSDRNCPAKVPLKRPTSTREDDSITEPESDKDLNQQPVQVLHLYL
ncbi:hypothetical protein C8R48DRAFT_677609 [Suillus tomentosus]|nr:hypothetical protein C8R48DRAFT_677609 [Suillus tomentosus]